MPKHTPPVRPVLCALLAFATVVSPFHSVVVQAQATPSIVIGEVAWAGSSKSTSDEWLELWNTTNSPISIGGWSLVGAGESGLAPAAAQAVAQGAGDRLRPRRWPSPPNRARGAAPGSSPRSVVPGAARRRSRAVSGSCRCRCRSIRRCWRERTSSRTTRSTGSSGARRRCWRCGRRCWPRASAGC